jgi:hypothetical protein
MSSLQGKTLKLSIPVNNRICSNCPIDVAVEIDHDRKEYGIFSSCGMSANNERVSLFSG